MMELAVTIGAVKTCKAHFSADTVGWATGRASGL